MKKSAKWLIGLGVGLGAVLLLVVILCISSLAHYYSAPGPGKTVYPWETADAWYCEEIDFTFYYTYDDRGTINFLETPLVWNDETYNIEVSFKYSLMSFSLPVSHPIFEGTEFYNPSGKSSYFVVEGCWEYVGENILFTIQNDALFGGAYKELIFVPTDVPKTGNTD